MIEKLAKGDRTMADVFLSYRRETGVECCSVLQKSLEEEGYSVFFDFNMRQGDFEQQIDKAITECSFMLVLLSPHDLDRCFEPPEKDWIVHEVALAKEYGKIIIPVAFKPHFEFPEECETIDALKHLSKLQICDVSGPEFTKLIKSKLYEYMEDSPAIRLKEEYQKGIRHKDYLKWEIKTLSNIYSERSFVSEFGRLFPAVVFEGSKKTVYPFDSLNDPDNLLPIAETIDYKNNSCYAEFNKIVGPNIHFPDLYGFTNVEMLFDEYGMVSGFKSVPRTYKETVFSGHILHYELWKAFKKCGDTRLATLEDLPIRRAIHKDKTNDEVIFSGCGRSSLCDVCLAVMAYDKEGDNYNIAVATRSLNVACYPGYLSIVPSGGFELYELENKQTPSTVRKNFSMVAAIYREYIEELFGDTDFDSPTGNDDLRRLYRNRHIKELREKINELFEFLGVSFDLISLRPTFSFVLKIDDPDFMYENQIKTNDENADIKFISFDEFDDYVIENYDQYPIMGESAGVYALLKKNHLYSDAMKKVSRHNE